MNKELYQSITLALITVAALVLLALLFAPVAEPLAWAVIIGVSTMPHYNRLAAKLPNSPNLSAAVMVLIVTVCVILPLGLLAYLVAQNAIDWYAQAEKWASSLKSGGGVFGQFPALERLHDVATRYGINISGVGSKVASGVSQFALDAVKGLAKNVVDLIFILVLTLFILYFVYRDGERVVNRTIGRFARNTRKANRLVSDLRDTMTSVTVGTLFTCLAQGVTAALGYWVASVPAPFLFGALTAIAALLPVVGTGFVWIPLCLLVAAQGALVKAGLLALWCLIFVGFADNAIRPLAIGATSDIPVPAVVLGAICGVFTVGLLGLILGPVVFAALVTVWRDAVTLEDGEDTSELPGS
ncbi:AI-2E family transporter [Geomesophilobacter sediminis]|uniref:AI-2E family transporter n=1 Tax=Geomesophilobacter sediminis TaxID=2798584 RepID=A0A8J7J5X5_9BACT|nr:AI-2E family transporter [Geomesophilobacter sediminis]MBJ6723971.1 AI-2E family transporter [Geomesophilobacter sediminis]